MSILTQIQEMNEQQRVIEIQKQDLKCQSFSEIEPFTFEVNGKTVNVKSITADGNGLISINFELDGVLDVARIKNPPILFPNDSGDVIIMSKHEDGTEVERRFVIDPKSIVIENITNIVK